MEKNKRFFFDDLPIDNLNLTNVVDSLLILQKKKEKKMRLVVCLNPNNVNWSYEDKEYRQAVKQADLVIADGWGVVWAGKILGYKLKERVTTADYFDQFCQMLVDNKLSVYLMGSQKEIIKRAVKNLKDKFPCLKIVGFHSGFFNRQNEREIVREINKARVDFLMVGLGTPKQEKWLYQNRNKLKVKVGWGIGAMFDYLAGEKKRCPVWLGKLGFEWLFRLLCEPRRLWHRYILGSVKFIFHCLKIYWKNKLSMLFSKQ